MIVLLFWMCNISFFSKYDLISELEVEVTYRSALKGIRNVSNNNSNNNKLSSYYSESPKLN